MTFHELKNRLMDAKTRLGSIASKGTLRADMEGFFEKEYSKKTVLGVDVFQYSKMELIPQSLVPFVLKFIFESSATMCIDRETFFFKKKSLAWFNSNNISTGDGFFQLFDNPFQALVFLVHFETNLKILNSMSSDEFPEVAMILGESLLVRYAMTEGPIFKFEDNMFGQGIVDCARIISKDKLNRFLVDSNIVEWFVVNLNGIETLQVVSLEDLKKIKLSDFNSKGSSVMFLPKGVQSMFNRVDVQKIEKISVKDDKFEVYNVHLQAFIELTDPVEFGKHIVAIGNLNTAGCRISPNIDFNLTYLGVTRLAKQPSRHPKRRLNQR